MSPNLFSCAASSLEWPHRFSIIVLAQRLSYSRTSCDFLLAHARLRTRKVKLCPPNRTMPIVIGFNQGGVSMGGERLSGLEHTPRSEA